jgi:hypothetical protein
MKSGSKQRLIEAPAAGLRYVGDGTALIGVPAKDLSAEELASYDVGLLLASGLYVAASAAEAAPSDPPSDTPKE